MYTFMSTRADSPFTDTIIAKMLLDECSLPAALRQVRIHNNFTSITELCAALNIPHEETQLLLSTYASFSSRKYFDKEFEQALRHVTSDQISDTERATQALLMLLEEAKKIRANDDVVLRRNRKEIFRLADRYRLPALLTEQLARLYLKPGSIPFREEFDRLFQNLFLVNPYKPLCARVTARIMLCQITETNAQQIAEISRILDNLLLEEDLLVIACRYLRTRTPQDIASTFEAVLKKLPYVDVPEENLSLAVRVLIDGTPESFTAANRQASLRHDTELLRRNLIKYPLYNGFEYDLAHCYGGKKSFADLDKEFHDLLNQLPYFRDPADNKELACKLLLGTLHKQQAIAQATYTLNLKEQTLSHGIAPEIIKNYLGNKSPEQLAAFFEQTLAPYTFWKNNREKYLFALRTLIGELNGSYNRKLSQFILDALENNTSVPSLTDIVSDAERKKVTAEQTDAFIQRYAPRCRQEKIV